MGLGETGIRFLVSARARGAPFDSIVTLGRQQLQTDPGALRETLAAGRVVISQADAQRLLGEADGFCEPLLRFLGADTIDSMDVSPYQKATIVHDLNLPVPDSLKGRFSLVLDGGSLEHVFNFPQAITNCMDLLRVGGHFLGITPANNFMGHGFYQFSPELFFRVFCRDNGFAPPRILVSQDDWRHHQWYEVKDPESARARVTLVNSHPTYMLIQAEKVAAVPPFSSTPQQSDYVVLWVGDPGDESSAQTRHSRQVKPGKVANPLSVIPRLLVPRSMKNAYHRWRAGNPFNPSHYRPVSE
jgi:SAM-dependent methyltransferase